jgi:hypothetical protein
MREEENSTFEPIKSGYLTKKELLASYHNAATFLHRGDLGNIVRGRKRGVAKETFLLWQEELITLLNHHQIYLADSDISPDGEPPLTDTEGQPVPKHQIIVIMHTADEGRVQATFFDHAGIATK